MMRNFELQRDKEFNSHVCAGHPKKTSAQRGRSLVANSSAQEAAKVASRFIPTCWICDKAITLENCAIDEYGKGVHAKCYATKLAHPKGKSIGEKEERWRELCALAAKEQDPQRLYTLVQEITDLLEQRERIKHQGKPPVRD